MSSQKNATACNIVSACNEPGTTNLKDVNGLLLNTQHCKGALVQVNALVVRQEYLVMKENLAVSHSACGKLNHAQSVRLNVCSETRHSLIVAEDAGGERMPGLVQVLCSTNNHVLPITGEQATFPVQLLTTVGKYGAGPFGEKFVEQVESDIIHKTLVACCHQHMLCLSTLQHVSCCI